MQKYIKVYNPALVVSAAGSAPIQTLGQKKHGKLILPSIARQEM